MAWFFLIVGIVLFAIGIGGQVRIRSKTRHLPPADRRTRRWVVTLGWVVAGALLGAIGLAHLLYMLRVSRQ